MPRDMQPTTRSLLRIGWNKEEVEGWRTVRQMLCPQHAAEWSVDLPWNKEADLTLPLEVLPDKEIE